jgi:hypothetical protein
MQLPPWQKTHVEDGQINIMYKQVAKESWLMVVSRKVTIPSNLSWVITRRMCWSGQLAYIAELEKDMNICMATISQGLE